MCEQNSKCVSKMLTDRAFWASNPAEIHVHFLNGDQLSFRPNKQILVLEELKQQIQKLKGIQILQQQVFPIPQRQELQGNELEDTEATGEDTEAFGVIRLDPGQRFVFQCNILPLQQDKFQLIVEQGDQDDHVETSSFVDCQEMVDTLKDMADLSAAYSWCGWEKLSMRMKKISASSPEWEIETRACNVVMTKPFQLDIEYGAKLSDYHSSVRLDFATSRASQTALTVIIHILESEGTKVPEKRDGELCIPAVDRIRKSFSRHVTGKRKRVKSRRQAKRNGAGEKDEEKQHDEEEKHEVKVEQEEHQVEKLVSDSAFQPCTRDQGSVMEKEDLTAEDHVQKVFIRGRDFNSLGDLIYSNPMFRAACEAARDT